MAFEPLFFGEKKRLFGIYDPPVGASKDHAVVICSSIFAEQQRIYWACKQIADRLSKQGYSVFRFDLTGTGQSGSSAQAASAGQWQADVKAALDEARSISGARRVSILAIRFGAGLAALAAQGFEIAHFIAFDPVFTGPVMKNEIQKARSTLGECVSAQEDEGAILGHCLRNGFLDEIAELKFLGMVGAKRTIVLSAGQTVDIDSKEHQCDLIGIDEKCEWNAATLQVSYLHEFVAEVCKTMT
jgi:pimeloyl-ACP methyl ester carboxylesterase